MSTSQADLRREIAMEQTHIDSVYRHLTAATKSAKSLAETGQAIFQTDRTAFVREEDGTALFERDAFAYQAARRLAILDAEHEGLVFGRLDLVDTEIRYVGRLGVRDEDYEPLVIDWRAPAAEPFYRATPANPMNVIRRRVLRCRDDQVIGIEDDLLDASANTELPIFGEGALMAAISRARGHTMRDIVATIQAEQDEAIRAPYQGVTIIGGGPGTGKTVVALHRAAYLLYTHRARLERGGVLVVGPSAVFMNYIERVLPSLGEESVTLRSIGSVATDVLGTGSERHDDAVAASIKGSRRMLPVLRKLIRLPLVDAEQQVRVTVKGEVLSLNATELAAIRDQVLASTRLNQGRNQAHSLVVAALSAKFPADVDLDPEERDELISEHAALAMFMNAWWPPLNAQQVLARLTDPQLVGNVAPNLSAAEQAALADSYAWLDIADEVTGWSVADMALLDELAEMLGPEPQYEPEEESLFLDLPEGAELVTTADRLHDGRNFDSSIEPHTAFAHILVDEGQDITPMQWRMLRRRGPQASWTIVGDPAQTSYPNQAETEQALAELIGNNLERRFVLSTNYRSPKEIFDLAGTVISRVDAGADLPNAVRRTGIEPKLATTTVADRAASIRAEVLSLAGQVQGTVGIVCPPSRLTETTTLIMQDERLRELDERLLVVTALQSKGLEYDGVLVLSPDEIIAEAAGGERALYVALTRATQRLTALDITDTTAAWRSLLG